METQGLAVDGVNSCSSPLNEPNVEKKDLEFKGNILLLKFTVIMK